jgi:hypothetical protein
MQTIQTTKLDTTFTFEEMETFGICTLLYKTKNSVGFIKQNGEVSATRGSHLITPIGASTNYTAAQLKLATQLAKQMSKKISEF